MKCNYSLLGMSVQDLLQKDVKQVTGPNIRLAISSLPSEYTVEVISNFFYFLTCIVILRNLSDN